MPGDFVQGIWFMGYGSGGGWPWHRLTTKTRGIGNYLEVEKVFLRKGRSRTCALSILLAVAADTVYWQKHFQIYIIQEANKRMQPTGTVELFGTLRAQLCDINKNVIVATPTSINGLASGMKKSNVMAARARFDVGRPFNSPITRIIGFLINLSTLAYVEMKPTTDVAHLDT
ncbi:armadillo-type fold protein [Artemisia annua]|uniref:Armadillo-type fold protein n=1 Tax=Artemisia annua TaxID=35608 RepID=A0A2U1MQ56_ARTAN|nr:armadillo-type fold protein [Artemisia annua]